MTGSVDLNPNHLGTVKAILAEHVPECEVRAFGSRATWTAKDYSDLDLAVVGEGLLDWRTLDRLKEAFEESDLPMRVDVLDWHAISDSFREVIERDYVVMQERAKQAMTGRWREVALGEIAEIFDGPHATPPKTDGGPVFLGISNLVDGRIDLSTTQHLSEDDYLTWTRRVTPMPGDVVFSYETRLGEAAAIPHGLRCCLGRRMGLLRPRTERVAPHFLLYAYLGPRFQETLRARAVQGSTVDRILLTEMGAFPIAIPVDVAEQRAIAHVLGRLDDKIELNRRMNETLEAMARALFKSWFVDFEPVRAKMEGRWRRGESLPGLPAELYDLFPGRLVGSEVGEVPEGWEVKALGDVAVQRRSGAKPEEIDPNTPYIALEHMPRRCIALSEWGTADGLASAKFRFEQGDILFGKLRPYFHKVGIAPLDGVCSTDIVVISPASPDWFGFVFGHVSSAEFVNYTEAASTGTKMPRTKWADMIQYKIALPAAAVAAAFDAIIQPSITRMLSAIHESRGLAAQRDIMLPKLVSGEVGVGGLMLCH